MKIALASIVIFLFALTAQGQPRKIMPWGDSICEGSTDIGGWRPRLMVLLHDAGFTNWDYVGRKDRTTNPASNSEAGFTIATGRAWPDSLTDYEGYNGRTAITWLGDMGAALVANPPDIIVGAIGTNDINAYFGQLFAQQIADTIENIIDTIYARRPNAKVILGNITKTWGAHANYNLTIDTINSILANQKRPKFVAARKFFVLVDQNAALSLAGDFEDDFHPSITGNPKMATAYLAAVKEALSPTRKIFGYLQADYVGSTYPIAALRFSSLVQVNILHFSGHMSSTPPYFAPSQRGVDSVYLSSNGLQATLISTLHANGSKIILSLTAQGTDGTILSNVCANQVTLKAFVSNVNSYLKRWGYDGLDFDWETSQDSASFSRLITAFRDTFNTWTPTPGILTATGYALAIPMQYSSWYNIPTMNAKLDYFFPMQYGMTGVINENWDGIYRRVYDCPYIRPTTGIWATRTYNTADFKGSHNSWRGLGLDSAKLGIGLSTTAITISNTTGATIPGDEGYGGMVWFHGPNVWETLPGRTYNAETDHWWGIIGGLYATWVDSAGTYKRTKWAVDTMGVNIGMLYDISTGIVNGRQPNLDAMINAMGSALDTTSVIATSVSSLTAFTSSVPDPSGVQSFTVSGVNLDANLVVTRPNANFEVSLSSGSGFGASVSLAPTSQTVATTTIYVRFTMATAGSSSGNIACTSTGATTRNVAVSGTASNPTSLLKRTLIFRAKP